MLEVSDYRAIGYKLLVRLKCTCGGRKILRNPDDLETFACARCGASTRMSDLKGNATTYWLGLVWEVEAETPKTEARKAVTNYAARLTAKIHRHASPYCTLAGYCVEMTPTTLVFLARDFKPTYARGIKSDQRFAIVEFEPPIKGLPQRIYGLIVELKYQEDEPPNAQLHVSFQDLLPQDAHMIAVHVRELAETQSTSSADFRADQMRKELGR